MKKLQKKICVALLLVMMLVLSACGASTETVMAMDNAKVAWEEPASKEIETEEVAEMETVNTSQIADSSKTVEEVAQYVEKIIYSGSVYL